MIAFINLLFNKEITTKSNRFFFGNSKYTETWIGEAEYPVVSVDHPVKLDTIWYLIAYTQNIGLVYWMDAEHLITQERKNDTNTQDLFWKQRDGQWL